MGASGVTFSNNRVHHNVGQGILFEISNGGSIHDNAVWENGWGNNAWGWGAGIVISSSGNANVYSNTVAWNAAGISVIAMNRPDTQVVSGNYIHNNTIVRKAVNGDFSQTYWNNLSLAFLSDGAPLYDASLNNHGASNSYYYDQAEGTTVRFSWAQQYMNLSSFNGTPGDPTGTYLSQAAEQQALTNANIPLTQQ